MRLPANVTIEKPRHPRSKCGTYVPGITGSHPLLREELVNLPNPLAFYVAADGEDLDMDESRVSGYIRLDLNRALLTREFIWGDKKRRQTLLQLPALCLHGLPESDRQKMRFVRRTAACFCP